MDEPFSALDALTRSDMRDWFLTMMDDLSLSSVLITHDVEEVVALADRVLVLGSASAEGGLPSTLIGEVEIDVPRDERDSFMLSEEALVAKRKVLELLG